MILLISQGLKGYTHRVRSCAHSGSSKKPNGPKAGHFGERLSARRTSQADTMTKSSTPRGSVGPTGFPTLEACSRPRRATKALTLLELGFPPRST